MNDIGFYSPSYKRAGKVTTDRLVPGLKIVVPESQEADYRKTEYRNGGQIVVCPDSADGNIGKKRNWILDNAPEDNIVVLDDDMEYIGYNEGRKPVRATIEEVEVLVWNGFRMARQLNTVMWGVNLNFDPKIYWENRPFNMLSPVLGPFSAIRRSECTLRYDARLAPKEDYDFWLQVIHRYHKTLRFNKWHYSVDHFSMAGGCVSNRSKEHEIYLLHELRRKWGRRVISFNTEKSFNPRVRVPYKGV